MRKSTLTMATLTMAAIAASSYSTSRAMAGSELDAALSAGGNRLTSNEIADLVVGKRVTARAGEKTFVFYYDPANGLTGKLQGGGWSGAGKYAITDGDQICVSMAQDKGRYRCLSVVKSGDVVQKFNAAGKMTFELIKLEPASGL